MNLILSWLLNALAIILTAYLLPGVQVKDFKAALITALVLVIINAVAKPILILITLPINILTLGLFTFVINAFVIIITSKIVPDFHVANFWWALLFSIVLSIISSILRYLLP